MFRKRFGLIVAIAAAILLSILLGVQSASATTLAFQSRGNPKQDGILTGEVSFESAALEKALKAVPEQQGVVALIPLSQIEGATFHFRYLSPYSGVEHTEASLCGKAIFDINGYEEDPLEGGREPALVLSVGGQPEFIDFSSCVGEAGSVSSKISQRDARITSSTVDSLFGKVSIFERDVMGNDIFKKIRPIAFTLRE